MKSRHRTRLFWIFSIVCLVVHVAIGLWRYEFDVSADGAEYAQMATQLLHTWNFTYDGVNAVVGKPPGLPALVALYSAAVGSLAGFHILQLLLLYASYIILAWMALKWIGPGIAVLMLVLLTLADPLRRLSANVYTEPLFLLLLVLSLFVLIHALEEKHFVFAIAAGVLIGLTTYVRPVTLFWPLLLVPMVWFIDRSRSQVVMTVLVAHCLIVAPWVIRNSLICKRPIPMVANWGPAYVMTDDSLWRGFMIEGWTGIHQRFEFDELLQGEFTFNPNPQERMRSATLRNWRLDSGGIIARCFRQSLHAWTFIPGTKQWEWQHPAAFWTGRGIMLIFYGLTAFGAAILWSRNRWLICVLGGYALYNAVLLFPVTTESRYLLGAYMCLLPLSAAGAWHLIVRSTKPFTLLRSTRS